MDRNTKLSWTTHVKLYLTQFAQETSIHGMRHIFSFHRHPIELLLWLVITTAALTYASWVIARSRERFETNPTVVSLERDHFNWNYTYASLTFCLSEPVNKSAAKELVKKRWPLAKEEEQAMYIQFVSAVANINHTNLSNFTDFANDIRFASIKDEMVDIAMEVLLKSESSISEVNDALQTITLVMGELGLCHTTNSAIAHHLSPISMKNNNGSVPVFKDIVYCQALDGKCSSMLKVGDEIKVFIHSPYDVPSIQDKYIEMYPNSMRIVEYESGEIISDAAIASLKHSQRHCVMITESQGKLPFFSYNTCIMQCRIRLAIKLCKCAPFYYLPLSSNFEVCNATGLTCLSQYKNKLTNLLSLEGKRLNCNCLQACDIVRYNVPTPKPPEFASMGGYCFFTSVLAIFNKVRYKKSILFGMEDLLVSYGGIAGFFLGCSLLSVVELIYFFTLRPCCKIISGIFCKPKTQMKISLKRQRRREIMLSFPFTEYNMQK